MKKKEFITYKNKSIKDLNKIVFEKKLDLEKLRMKIFAGKEKNVKLGRNLRTEIAKILTLIKEKEIIEVLQSKIKKEVESKSVKE